MFKQGRTDAPTLPGRPVRPASPALPDDRKPKTRPAAKPLIATGRAASDETLVREVVRLRRRASQQDETMSRLVEALRALGRGCESLRDENRELRRALEQSRLQAL